MKKKQYLMPAILVVTVKDQLLSGSGISRVNTNLDTEDYIDISETPAEEGFWGR